MKVCSASCAENPALGAWSEPFLIFFRVTVLKTRVGLRRIWRESGLCFAAPQIELLLTFNLHS